MHILMVEDDLDILENISEYLEEKKYILDFATNAIQALNLLQKNNYSLILLDINLPRMNGFQLCQRIKEQLPNIPIIMISARDQLQDRLDGFSYGAEDYLVKPFALSELHARIVALLKRCNQLNYPQVLQVADLRLDLGTRKLTRDQQILHLPPIALAVLEKLMKESPNVVSRQELERNLWKDEVPNSDSLRTHIHLIRQVIDKPFNGTLLQTVHGVGFKICG
ncbi:DNA-binding response regulator [Acinetobacter sp. ANC 4558]|uniref:response regulator transcription factor n=1 Tax=Acinetobacter sp. ANC 4558 TaxID=1977876 RepID=UPI000A3502F0|nr:response regulator transcription factor [Acinetobacter sp. ANC 4558]OTG87140.1 DNA-binding response regulator [Acinetobacter sp. ANC 4558]